MTLSWLLPRPAIAISGMPSPLKSPVATTRARLPTMKLVPAVRPLNVDAIALPEIAVTQQSAIASSEVVRRAARFESERAGPEAINPENVIAEVINPESLSLEANFGRNV